MPKRNENRKSECDHKRGETSLYCARCARDNAAELSDRLTPPTDQPGDVDSLAVHVDAKPQNVPVARVPELFEQALGKRPSISTVKRWIREGYRGVKLRTEGPAHFRCCNAEWVREFVKSTSDSKSVQMMRSERAEADVKRTRQSVAGLKRYGIVPKGFERLRE